MFLAVLVAMLVLLFSNESITTPHTTKLALDLFQPTYLQMVLHHFTLTTHPTHIGTLQGNVLALRQVSFHFLVRGFEAAVPTYMRSLRALLSNMLLQSILGDSQETVEGTLGVHVLAGIKIRVQVSAKLVQGPRPDTPPLLHITAYPQGGNSLLIFHELESAEVVNST